MMSNAKQFYPETDVIKYTC